MDIKSFPIKIDELEAERIAEAKGGLLWKAMFAGKKVSQIKRYFIEFKLITFEAVNRPTLIEKLFFHETEIKKQKITMLADGTTGSVSWVESMPDIVTMKDIDEMDIQLSDKDNHYLSNQGRKIATKVMHRHIGGIPELKVLKIESIFRPYWVAFYGDVIEGEKVRYLPIAADGCGSHRGR